MIKAEHPSGNGFVQALNSKTYLALPSPLIFLPLTIILKPHLTVPIMHGAEMPLLVVHAWNTFKMAVKKEPLEVRHSSEVVQGMSILFIDSDISAL